LVALPTFSFTLPLATWASFFAVPMMIPFPLWNCVDRASHQCSDAADQDPFFEVHSVLESVVVLSPPDSAAHGPEDHENQPDHEHDDSYAPQDRDLGDEADQQ
jgi:hypothetical protein